MCVERTFICFCEEGSRMYLQGSCRRFQVCCYVGVYRVCVYIYTHIYRHTHTHSLSLSLSFFLSLTCLSSCGKLLLALLPGFRGMFKVRPSSHSLHTSSSSSYCNSPIPKMKLACLITPSCPEARIIQPQTLNPTLNP